MSPSTMRRAAFEVPHPFMIVIFSIFMWIGCTEAFVPYSFPSPPTAKSPIGRPGDCRYGWVQDGSGEWTWEEEMGRAVQEAEGQKMANSNSHKMKTQTNGGAEAVVVDRATPRLPSGTFRPKQSLGQNFLRDGNTVGKIVRTFVADAAECAVPVPVPVGGESTVSRHSRWEAPGVRPVELGPGAGALTGSLLEVYGHSGDGEGGSATVLRCVEIDSRAVEMLERNHPGLRVDHADVLDVDYAAMAVEEGGPLSIVGNLPYYITSQILFALADASHNGAVRSATVTMQWEVAQRIVAPPGTKDYGILTVVFGVYCEWGTDPKSGHGRIVHFKIPPTVFYPKPKVDSALVGLRFVGPDVLRRRLAGVNPIQLRRVLAAVYQQRRKTIRNSLGRLLKELYGGSGKDGMAATILQLAPLPVPEEVRRAQDAGDPFALSQKLPEDWAGMRPEQLSPGQTVELTRLVFSGLADKLNYDDGVDLLPKKVWRRFRHGPN